MYKMKPLASAVSCILAAGSFVATSAVVAQDNRTDNEGVLEEIVVTGSRIKRDVFSAASSIDVISTDDASLAASPMSLRCCGNQLRRQAHRK